MVHLYGNNWTVLPLAVFKPCFHHLFWRVILFIYYRETPPPMRRRERGEHCYLRGIVISWALPLWLELAPAEPSERLVALRWRGKVDFFFLHCLHSHINLLFTLYQFASQYLSHLICFFVGFFFPFLATFHIHFLCFHLFLLLISACLFITLISSEHVFNQNVRLTACCIFEDPSISNVSTRNTFFKIIHSLPQTWVFRNDSPLTSLPFVCSIFFY